MYGAFSKVDWRETLRTNIVRKDIEPVQTAMIIGGYHKGARITKGPKMLFNNKVAELFSSSGVSAGARFTVSGRQSRIRINMTPPNIVKNHRVLRQCRPSVKAPPMTGARPGPQRGPRKKMPIA